MPGLLEINRLDQPQPLKIMRVHSWLSPACEVRESPCAGLGVFAVLPIAEGDLVAVWGGAIYTASEISELGQTYPHFLTHPIEVAPGFFLGSTSHSEIDDAERFNHGCDPNVGVRGQLMVLARRDIQPGEELLFDYETTDSAPAPFACCCGAPHCRQQIDGRAARSPEFRKSNAKWMSSYMLSLGAQS